MKIDRAVKEELLDLYSNLRDAQENWKEATQAVADKMGKKAKHIRQRIKLEATGKLEEFEQDLQLVLEL